MKRCCNCDKQKDDLEFYNNKRYADGKDGYCKACRKARVIAYQKTDKGKVVRARAQRKWINTPHGRAKKQECEHNWKQTENGKEHNRQKALKRYHSDPEHYRLKVTARRHGCPIGVLKQVQERDKVCQFCGTDKDLQFDHKYPVSLGGKGTLENLQLLCKECNNFKSNNLILEGGEGMLVIQACNI